MVIIQKINRLGERKVNNYGSIMTIIEYNNANNIIIEFEDGYRTKSCYKLFKNRSVKNPNDKTVYEIGYIGTGYYKPKTIQYKYWMNMMNRCYNKQIHATRPTYEDKSICEEWHNFQNFAKWFDENYYEIREEKMCLDKDILVKKNKVYSPNTCIFAPNRINTLFIKANVNRGNLPIGVYYAKDRNKFRSICNIGKLKRNLGTFNTPEEAFYAYKEFKEQYIKQVADEYKDKIPERLYNAMYNYKVDIDD